MSIQRASYKHRGNGNYGVVIHLPMTVGDRLVYFDYNRRTGSWVIRDFQAGRLLTNHDSSLSVDDIEKEADYDEVPATFNKDNIAQWRAHLHSRSVAAIAPREGSISVDMHSATDRWKALRRYSGEEARTG